jgi:hypothetical protein
MAERGLGWTQCVAICTAGEGTTVGKRVVLLLMFKPLHQNAHYIAAIVKLLL